MHKLFIASTLAGALVLQACGPAPTPRQQQQRQHEIACTAGLITGALVGGAIGNQFGGGRGRDILTIGGGVAGGLSGLRYSC